MSSLTNEHGPLDFDGPADHGLFGPGSVTWRVMAEPVMWVAGLRALYLQALHPDTMLGTWQNTSFTDPSQAWGRFMRTTEFVRVRTFGSTAEVERAGRRLRKIHALLHRRRTSRAASSASTSPTCCCGCTAARSRPTPTSPAAAACP